MNKLVAALLIAAASGYTLIVAFLIVFTIGFFGVGSMGDDLIGLAVFCLIGLSPLAVWPYCLRRAAAWRRGEYPPFDGSGERLLSTLPGRSDPRQSTQTPGSGPANFWAEKRSSR